MSGNETAILPTAWWVSLTGIAWFRWSDGPHASHDGTQIIGVGFPQEARCTTIPGCTISTPLSSINTVQAVQTVHYHRPVIA